MTNYTIVTYRPETVTVDPRLLALSDSLYEESKDIQAFVGRVQDCTAQHLVFRMKNKGSTALQLLQGGEANCVGYARLMVSILNASEQIEREGYRVKQGVAKIRVLGIDIHRFFNSPFFRDHDIVVLTHPERGTTLYGPAWRTTREFPG